MAENETRLREILAGIAEMARAAVESDEHPDNGHAGQDDATERICSPKALPTRLQVSAAQTASRINPVNAPVHGPLAGAAADLRIDAPLSLAVLTSKYWGATPRQLLVSFTESQPRDLRARIIAHMNAWASTACITFAETQQGGQVRISTLPGGYWSYLGTDILLVPSNRPTMNLERFTMKTPESEFVRVVRHETGHTLGFPHEHMRKELVARIDPAKAYDYFGRAYGWSRHMVIQQVLAALDERSLMATPADQTSIMCYQLPGSITRDGRPIVGGTDINQTDYQFAGRIYPKPGHQQALDVTPAHEDEWDESEDVVVTV